MPRKKTAAPSAAPSSVVKTIAAAAKRVGVAERVLAGWLAAGCPGETGAYDVDAITAWRAANRRPARNKAEGSDNWEKQRRKYAAKREKLKFQRERGELIMVSRAAQVIKQAVAEVTTHLDQLPDYAVAGCRLPADTRRKLKERIKAKVRELRSTLEGTFREMARTAKREGAADSDE